LYALLSRALTFTEGKAMDNIDIIMQQIINSDMSLMSILQILLLAFVIYKFSRDNNYRVKCDDDIQRGNSLILKLMYANVELGIVTAAALRDGKTNGTLQNALENASLVKTEYNDYLTESAYKRKEKRLFLR
jgi:ABC-type multidrug transport system fused ATPase/permease subunit